MSGLFTKFGTALCRFGGPTPYYDEILNDAEKEARRNRLKSWNEIGNWYKMPGPKL